MRAHRRVWSCDAGRSAAGSVAALAMVLLAGCGAQYYQERLEATRKLYAYYQKLDERLSPVRRIAGVEIRVPRPFQPISGGGGGADDGSGDGEQPRDPRQPDWFAEGIDLPGMAGAWRADLPVPGGKQLPAYLYLLSNYDLWEKSQDEAMELHSDVQRTIIEGLNLPTSKVLSWGKVSVPDKAPSFAEKREYTAASETFSVDGELYLLTTYLFQSGDNQAALLYARPQDGETAALKESIDLMLETIQLTSEKPRFGEDRSLF